MSDNWTVSTDDARRTKWAVYCNGRRVLGGWDTSTSAEWALDFLRDGKVPPDTPSRESIAWPAHMEVA